MFSTNNISTNYEARSWGGGGGRAGRMALLTVLLALKKRCLDKDRGGLFDIPGGGVGRFGQSKNYLHRWEKPRSSALFITYRGQFSVFVLSAAGIFFKVLHP